MCPKSPSGEDSWADDAPSSALGCLVGRVIDVSAILGAVRDRECCCGRPAPLTRCSAVLSPARSLTGGQMKRCTTIATAGTHSGVGLAVTRSGLLARCSLTWDSDDCRKLGIQVCSFAGLEIQDSAVLFSASRCLRCCRTTPMAHRWNRPAGDSACCCRRFPAVLLSHSLGIRAWSHSPS